MQFLKNMNCVIFLAIIILSVSGVRCDSGSSHGFESIDRYQVCLLFSLYWLNWRAKVWEFGVRTLAWSPGMDIQISFCHQRISENHLHASGMQIISCFVGVKIRASKEFRDWFFFCCEYPIRNLLTTFSIGKESLERFEYFYGNTRALFIFFDWYLRKNVILKNAWCSSRIILAKNFRWIEKDKSIPPYTGMVDGWIGIESHNRSSIDWKYPLKHECVIFFMIINRDWVTSILTVSSEVVFIWERYQIHLHKIQYVASMYVCM